MRLNKKKGHENLIAFNNADKKQFFENLKEFFGFLIKNFLFVLRNLKKKTTKFDCCCFNPLKKHFKVRNFVAQ